MWWAEHNPKDGSSVSDSKQANAMLGRAQRVFKTLHGCLMLNFSPAVDEIYGLHVQQAVEKCLYLRAPSPP